MIHQQFDRDFTRQLFEQAVKSPRRRAHHNVHESYNEAVQRLYVAMMPDSYVRPHRHTDPSKWEFFMVVEGKITVLIFDDHGTVTNKVELSAGGDCFGLQIPPGTWHATFCQEPVVFFEVKQGPYLVEADKNFAGWAPAENDHEVADFLDRLKHTEVGERA